MILYIPNQPALGPNQPALAPNQPALAPNQPALAPNQPAPAPNQPAPAQISRSSFKMLCNSPVSLRLGVILIFKSMPLPWLEVFKYL